MSDLLHLLQHPGTNPKSFILQFAQLKLLMATPGLNYRNHTFIHQEEGNQQIMAL